MKLTKQQRAELKQKYGGKCAYCGCELGERWHLTEDEIKNEIGVITASENGYNNVQFKGGWYSNIVPDNFIVPVSPWISCSDELPKIDSATRESNEVFFEDLDETIHHGWFRDGRSDEHSMYFIANLNAEIKSIDKVIRWMYVPS